MKLERRQRAVKVKKKKKRKERLYLGNDRSTYVMVVKCNGYIITSLVDGGGRRRRGRRKERKKERKVGNTLAIM